MLNKKKKIYLNSSNFEVPPIIAKLPFQNLESFVKELKYIHFVYLDISEIRRRKKKKKLDLIVFNGFSASSNLPNFSISKIQYVFFSSYIHDLISFDYFFLKKEYQSTIKV